MNGHAAAIVFAVVFVTRLGIPLPASPLLIFVGALASRGEVPWAITGAASVLANLLGDLCWYAAGRRYGRDILDLICKISMSPDKCVSSSARLIARWGGSALTAAKFLPGVSVIVAPVAGASRMSWGRFIAFDIAAALIWTSSFLSLGYAFGDQVQSLIDQMAEVGTAATALVVLAMVAVPAGRLVQKLTSRAMGASRAERD